MILFISKSYNNRNGAARSGIDVVKSIVKADAQLGLLYVNSNNNFKEIPNYNKIPILRSPRFKSKLNKFNTSNIKSYIEGKIFDNYRINKIKSLDIKFIIANSLSAEPYAKNLSKILSVKSCLIVRESTEFYANPKKTSNRINYFDYVVFVSSNVMKKWISIAPELENKSTYIPNTINQLSINNVITQSKNYFKNKLHFSDKEVNLVVVGKFIDRKNQNLIISNLNKFTKADKKIKFHFIGKNLNSYGQKMKNILRQSSYKEMVSLYGFRKNILEYIYAADCLLLTANAEASPRVIYEAMALKTIVIASDIDGVPELIKDNETGYLYKKNDIDDLFLKMKESLSSNETNNIVESAYRHYHQTFSNQIHEKNYKKLLNLLESL